ncbi:AAA family ATPase [Actinosynnema sp. NPDC020468]|uniref:AAA family ATPase n=1 Tax=Actinosynnema sp. NPDC020468 TaxID=3154488 RepID=UPI0033F618B2
MEDTDRAVVIGIVGTHSTGKTQFLSRLAHELRLHDINVATVADLGEQAQRSGLPILHNHTAASTLWFITTGISNETEAAHHAEVVLVDRAAPDALGYYLAALHHREEHPDPDTLAWLGDFVRHHSHHHYDLLYRTTLDTTLPLGTNKPRDGDRRFRELADHHVATVLEDLALSHTVIAADSHDRTLREAQQFVFAKLSAPDPPSLP